MFSKSFQILLVYLGLVTFYQCGKADIEVKKLRSDPIQLTKTEAKKMVKEKGFFDKYWNQHQDFMNRYQPLKMNGNEAVFDKASGLLWHPSGSPHLVNLTEALQWIKSLNKKNYAGHQHWRLPTLEEALSLLEKEKKHRNLYIDPLFDRWQWCIWTSDKLDDRLNWVVVFSGRLDWFDTGVGFNYVRPVCSLNHSN